MTSLYIKKLSTFIIMYRSDFLSMRNFSDKIIYKFQTHILCSITFIENRYVCEIMWKNTVELGRTQMVIWRMRIAC